jgi:hypothetical protein
VVVAPLVAQIVVPNRWHAPMPTEQPLPSVVNVSSVEPLQLSSILFQSSLVGDPAVTEHVVVAPPLAQTVVPKRWQAPIPTLQPVPSVVNVSSAEPLQLSSIALHSSLVGEPAVAEQVVIVWLLAQTVVPNRWHAPTPTLQLLPRPVNVSSAEPLQLSSSALHSSVAGVPAVTEHVVVEPFVEHTVVPNRWHVPVPTGQLLPRVGYVSSTEPLQLSSTRLHVSAVGVPATTEHSVAVPSALQRMLPMRWHPPTPGWQIVPRPVNPSSTLLSQSSSA